jgi:hypothetical protein
MLFTQRYNFKVGYFSCALENNVNLLNIKDEDGSTLED